MTPALRLSRFGQWKDIQPGCQGGEAKDQLPFFAGDRAYERMDAVRRAINEIRSGWQHYPQFAQELRQTVTAMTARANDDAGATLWEALLSGTKSWSDGTVHRDRRDYTAIDLYTSEAGYSQFYRVINTALRRENIVSDEIALRATAFIVELMNIDLFNYLARNSEADNFVGTVYRGMSFTKDDLEYFRRIARGPISGRYIAIPLSMASASLDMDTALAFAMREAEYKSELHPLLWEIKVHGLPVELLAQYRERYPRSIVTSMCAVPISEISFIPTEREVLLRGPFFQILNLGEPELIPGFDLPVTRIELIMLNSNRDHLTAIASNEGTDREARDLFRAMVLEQRSILCSRRATELGLRSDAEAYRAVAEANHRRVASTLRGVSTEE